MIFMHIQDRLGARVAQWVMCWPADLEVLRFILEAEIFSTANRPRGYKTFFMLNSIEHEIFPAHKC